MTGQAARAGSVVTRAGDECAWARASLGEDVSAEGAEARVFVKTYHRLDALAPEPVACVRHCGPTPFHPEPGRETQ
jgi:hypothetical protein